MPRQFKQIKPYIVVFCEGESEQAYTEFLRKRFKDVAVISKPLKGLFDEADSKFRRDARFRDNTEVTDEIWFFFDVEKKNIPEWNNRLKIVKRLRSLRKKPNIRVRLLMTTGCIEYWLLLHYELLSPPIQTVADKERIMERLLSKEPAYKKGNAAVTGRIAEKYLKAAENARKTVSNLMFCGLPGLEDSDERNQWLCTQCLTFSTVYEAIDYLTNL